MPQHPMTPVPHTVEPEPHLIANTQDVGLVVPAYNACDDYGQVAGTSLYPILAWKYNPGLDLVTPVSHVTYEPHLYALHYVSRGAWVLPVSGRHVYTEDEVIQLFKDNKAELDKRKSVNP